MAQAETQTCKGSSKQQIVNKRISTVLSSSSWLTSQLNCMSGLDIVAAIASIPTYKPGERIRQFNDLAKFLGDERAQNARAIWNRPLKTVYISDCGALKVAKPSLSPTLP